MAENSNDNSDAMGTINMNCVWPQLANLKWAILFINIWVLKKVHVCEFNEEAFLNSLPSKYLVNYKIDDATDLEASGTIKNA